MTQPVYRRALAQDEALHRHSGVSRPSKEFTAHSFFKGRNLKYQIAICSLFLAMGVATLPAHGQTVRGTPAGEQAIRQLVASRSSSVAAAPVSASAFSSDVSDVQATVRKWVADLNKGDSRSLLAACARHTAIVDGFPPYVWQTCSDWWDGYEANNKRIQGADGTISIGKPIYTEVTGDNAYIIYPATFTDIQKGKRVTCKGSWTMTLQKTKAGWLFKGSASARGVNTL